MSKFFEGLCKVRHFFSYGVWELDIYSFGGIKRQVIHVIRVVQLVVRGYREDRLSLHAASLTFTTLMSLVPFLAFIFAMFKGIGDESALLKKVDEAMSSLPEALQSTLTENVINPVLTINPAALGAFGSVVFLFAVIKVLGSIERSFNTVWGVSESRNLLRKFTDYISTIVVVPFAVVAGSAIRELVPHFLKEVVDAEPAAVEMGVEGVVQSASGAWVNVSSLLLICFAFWFLYRFLPNTQVRAYPALVAGVVVGSLAVVWHRAGLGLLSDLVAANPVYATFASVPLFMLVLYITWVLVLLGAELSFAIQNSSTYVMEQKAVKASMKSRLRLALAIMVKASDSMMNALPRFNVHAYVKKNHVPIRLVNETMSVLKAKGLFSEDSEVLGTFVLLRTPDQVTVQEIIDLIMEHGSTSSELGLRKLDIAVEEALDSVGQGLDAQLNGLTFRELVER